MSAALGHDAMSRQLSRKLLSTLDRLGCLSFRSAFASICRMRSRVTENCWPTSSSVWSLFMRAVTMPTTNTMNARVSKLVRCAIYARTRYSKLAQINRDNVKNLRLVWAGLGLYLWHRNSPSQAYQLAASYCEHYDPRYGNGLNGPSAERIQEIAGFTLAVETHESGGARA
jgi:hypothetical protein